MIAVVQPGNAQANDDTTENAHLQGHDAASAGNRPLQYPRCNLAISSHLTTNLQGRVAGNIHDEVGNHGRKSGNFFFRLRHADCYADSEDDWQVAENRITGAAHNHQQGMQQSSAAEKALHPIHLDCRRIRERAAYTQQQASNRQDSNRQHEAAANALQNAEDLIFHSVNSSFPQCTGMQASCTIKRHQHRQSSLRKDYP